MLLQRYEELVILSGSITSLAECLLKSDSAGSIGAIHVTLKSLPRHPAGVVIIVVVVFDVIVVVIMAVVISLKHDPSSLC